ncbi:MAG TPA: hypothetical protein VHI11_04320, partial [Jiangellaceae bacterium]|nr:hypothetical protein [Jiangellaceae bacterium]
MRFRVLGPLRVRRSGGDEVSLPEPATRSTRRKPDPSTRRSAGAGRLDNCEHVVDTAAHLAEGLAARRPWVFLNLSRRAGIELLDRTLAPATLGIAVRARWWVGRTST